MASVNRTLESGLLGRLTSSLHTVSTQSVTQSRCGDKVIKILIDAIRGSGRGIAWLPTTAGARMRRLDMVCSSGNAGRVWGIPLGPRSSLEDRLNGRFRNQNRDADA